MIRPQLHESKHRWCCVPFGASPRFDSQVRCIIRFQPCKPPLFDSEWPNFLKHYSPFDVLSDDDLRDLAGSGRVKFHESDEYLFRQDQAKEKFVWIVQQGRVELLDGQAPGEQLCDLLGKGDLLGLERFVGERSYLRSARTASDVIIYSMAAEIFESLVPRYPALQRFLAARFTVSGILGFGKTSWLDADCAPAEFLRARLVAVQLDSSMAEITSQVVGADSSVVALVDGGRRFAGMITPLELCTGQAGSVRSLARPCPAAAAPLTVRGAVREMLMARTEELAITADGTLDSPLEAIVTASELALFCGHNPMRLVRAIRRASSIVEIVPLRQRADRIVLDGLVEPRDVDDCCRIATEAAAAMVDACIRLANRSVEAAGLNRPECPACWVTFGASARGDLLETALPSIAAIYDDSSPRFKPQDSLYFSALAGETMARLHDCGLTGPGMFWPEGTWPSMPLSEWRRLYCETIRNPFGADLFARREFLDVAPLSGDGALLRSLPDCIELELRECETMIPLLANDTLANLPPLTFFHGLVLELDGVQRDSFDIEAAAITPIVSAARVFALAKHRLSPANTLTRLEAAMLDFPEGAEILREAVDAFRIALYYRALAGSAQIFPGSLGKFDQLLLKSAFSSVHRLLEFTSSTFIPPAR